MPSHDGRVVPTKSMTAAETASVMLNHIGRFGSPEVIHTDQGPAFHNELVHELLRLCAIENSFATAYSSEENGIVERANQEVLRHLRALLFDSRVHDKWSCEQLPLVQPIMNTVEKTSTGVTPADLILSHSIRLTSHIISPIRSSIDSSDISLSDRMDEWISRQYSLLVVAQESQLQSDQHKVCDTAIRTQYVLPATSPVSHLTQTSFTTHSVQYTQYTLCVHILSSLHSVLMLHSCS